MQFFCECLSGVISRNRAYMDARHSKHFLSFHNVKLQQLEVKASILLNHMSYDMFDFHCSNYLTWSVCDDNL